MNWFAIWLIVASMSLLFIRGATRSEGVKE